MKLTKKEKKILLKLSRLALVYIFKEGEELPVEDSDIPEKLKKDAATFVTLTKDGRLRGCIGKLKAQKSLYMDVLENTYKAAFNDPRFPQLTKKELEDIQIEISVLSQPKPLKYKDTADLKSILNRQKPGVVLQHGLYSATYLPQVWEDLRTVDKFLGRLCQKAGLDRNTWKKENIELFTYNVVKLEE